jgi:transposase
VQKLLNDAIACAFEETSKLAHRRASKVRVVTARVRYKTVDAEGNTDIVTAAMPAEMLPGSIAAPSLVAHIIMENIGKGMPLFRLEDSFDRAGSPSIGAHSRDGRSSSETGSR